MTLDSRVLSTVLWPSSHSSSLPSLSSFLLRAPFHHSLQWTKSLLSPLVLLFPLFPPQQDRKTEEIQQERQREGGDRWRQAERDVGISALFFCHIIEPILTLKENDKNQTKVANFTVLHMHNQLAGSLKKEIKLIFWEGQGWMCHKENICSHV